MMPSTTVLSVLSDVCVMCVGVFVFLCVCVCACVLCVFVFVQISLSFSLARALSLTLSLSQFVSLFSSEETRVSKTLMNSRTVFDRTELISVPPQGGSNDAPCATQRHLTGSFMAASLLLVSLGERRAAASVHGHFLAMPHGIPEAIAQDTDCLFSHQSQCPSIFTI